MVTFQKVKFPLPYHNDSEKSSNSAWGVALYELSIKNQPSCVEILSYW